MRKITHLHGSAHFTIPLSQVLVKTMNSKALSIIHY